MKPIYTLVMAVVSLSAAAHAQQADRTIRKALTDEQFQEQKQELKRQEEERLAKVSAQQVSLEQDPSKVNKPAGLLAQSEVLNYGGFATLVPKRAILHLPKALQTRTGLGSDDKIQGWQEFYLNNRGWISTMEVSRKQAQGKEPLSEESLKIIGESSSIIVATCYGNPISVLPLQTPPPQGESGNTNPQSK
jgi:hypothetical protein